MMQLGIDDFTRALCGYDKHIRQHASFVVDTIARLCPRALSSQTSLPQNFFERNARALYEQATTEGELEALCECWFYAYETHAKQHPKLLPPKRFFPVKRQLPLISEHMPKLERQELLVDMLQNQLPKAHKLASEIRWMMLVLSLARHLDIRQTQRLEVLIATPIESYIILSDAKRAVVLLEKGNAVYLDAIGLLYLRKLQSEASHARYVKRIASVFNMWATHCFQSTQNALLTNITLADTLDALSFITRVPANESIGPLPIPLNASKLIFTLSGNHNFDFIEATGKPQSRRRRSFEKLQTQIKEKSSQNYTSIAFQSSVMRHDKDAMQRIRNALTEFSSNQTNANRNTVHFKVLRQQLLQQINDFNHDKNNISAVAQLIATYCIDLFLYGSVWKQNLAVNTILTYLSTLTTFASSAWGDEALLQSAQYDVEAQIELTELVADVISATDAPDKQSTVLNFLQYVSQTSAIVLFDEDELEYQGTGLINVRPHYIAPHDFDTACHRFLNDVNSAERRQCIHFVRLCYALGFRDKEAAQLEIDDIDFSTNSAYITKHFKRKTKTAIRRVPLCFFHPQHINTLEDYIADRESHGLTTVFDAPVIASTLPSFIRTLREVLDDDTLVLHSLRHSAANNLLFQLSIACSARLSSLQERYSFLQHPIFSAAQIQDITSALDACGRSTGEFFPVLDTLANLLGHVSPTVTAASYLHLSDVLMFELGSGRQATFSAESLSQLMSSNNYRYSLKKLYQSSVGELDEIAREALLFKAATHGLKVKTRIAHKKHGVLPVPNLNRIAFSDYIRALYDYKYRPHREGGNSLLRPHFDKVSHDLNIDFTTSIQAHDFAVWQRLYERLSHLDWTRINRHALEVLHDALIAGKITDKRTANRYLRALSLLGLRRQKINIISPKQNDTQVHDWVELITSSGHTITLVEKGSSQTFIQLRPRHLRWRPWDHLNDLLPIVFQYINLCEEGGVHHEHRA
ncbi:tyrosine-type recombinase/integrase [Aliidiomarina shirensis]|nr:tyrosine-type recombinase/integrase [Aliidiomarina shirensis]